MGLPSKKRPRSEKRTRASHFALIAPAISTCLKCKKPVRPHHVCMSCGTYNGRQALNVATRSEKKLRKREKARAKQEKQEQEVKSAEE